MFIKGTEYKGPKDVFVNYKVEREELMLCKKLDLVLSFC